MCPEIDNVNGFLTKAHWGKESLLNKRCGENRVSASRGLKNNVGLYIFNNFSFETDDGYKQAKPLKLLE